MDDSQPKAAEPNLPPTDHGLNETTAPTGRDTSVFPYATWGPWAGIIAVLPFAILALLAIGGSDTDDESVSVGLAVGAQLVQASIFISVPLIVAALTLTKAQVANFFGSLGFRKVPIGRALKWIGLGALAYYCFLILVVAVIGEPQQDDISGDFGPIIVQFLLIAIVASFSEELFFRSLLFGGLRTKMPMIAAALVSGILFGAMHAPTGPSAVLPLAFFGFVLAVVYEKTGSIWPSMALHTLNNSIVLIALNAS